MNIITSLLSQGTAGRKSIFANKIAMESKSKDLEELVV